jgi:WD40 repeat protein/serine/threonine protein kinase
MPNHRPPTITDLPTEEWERLDRAVREFETAWNSGTAPDLADYAPDDPRLRALALAELVRVELELRLKNKDDGTRLEVYLSRFPELNDPDRLTALAAWEFQLRSRHKPPALPDEYAKRFPHLAGRFSGWMMPTLTETAPPKVADTGPRLPDIKGFQVIEELGRGGVGVVYRAKELQLGRDVAVKMIIAGAQAGPVTRDRLRNEATALARLRHPNIVPVYEVGEHDGLPYVVLEYVAGGSLAKFQAGRPLPIPVVVAWTEAIARAVQHAHEADIIHRDIKPANVLLQWPKNAPKPAGGAELPDVETMLTWIPRLTDFGLAKNLENVSEATPSGALLGTPGYMAPEQAEGHSRKVGPPADIFALGAVLYELLTGRAPFYAESIIDTLMQVINVDPIRPSRLRPGLPADLEQICLKCLNKAPEKRYHSAAELADDLARFRERKPVKARPASALERLNKWVRRYPAAAGLIAVAFSALIVISILWVLAERQRRLAEDRLETNRLNQALKQLDQEERFAALGGFVQVLDQAQRHPERAAIHRLRATSVFRRPPRLTQLVGQEDRINVALFDPSGQVLLTAGTDGARAWNPRTGALRARLPMKGEMVAAALDRTGMRAAIASLDGTAKVWDLAAAQPVGVERQHGENLTSIALSPKGDWMLTVGRDDTGQSSARIWPVEGQGAAFTLPNPEGVREAHFVKDGQQVLTAGGDGAARLWDTSPPPSIAGPACKHGPGLNTATMSADGQQVATGGSDGVIRRWHTDSGDAMSVPLQHGDPVRKLAYNAAGTRLLSIGDRSIRLWDLTKEPAYLMFAVVGEQPFHAPFSPDGNTVIISTGKLARVWNAVDGRPVSEPLRHSGDVRSVAIAPDGNMFATAATDGLARVWNLRGDEPKTFRHGDIVYEAACNPDGSMIVTAGEDRLAKLWNVSTNAVEGSPWAHDEKVIAASFSPDGKSVLTASYDGTALLWSVATGQQLLKINAHADQISRAVFSPNGQIILTAGGDGAARLWDAATGQQLGPDLKHDNYVFHAGFSRDGRRVVTASYDGTAAIWNVADGQRLLEVKHPPAVMFADLDPTGKILITAGKDRTARLWNAQTGNAIGEPLVHADDVLHADFDPAGRWVVTASADGTARMWHLSDGQKRGSIAKHRGGIFRVTVNADGRYFATASVDGSARIWDAATGLAITPPLQHAGPVRCVQFRPDQAALLTGSADGTAKLWDIVADGQSINDWKRWASLLTGMHYDLDRDDEPLGPGEALRLWRLVEATVESQPPTSKK